MSDEATPVEAHGSPDGPPAEEASPSLWRILAAPVALALSVIALLFGIMIGVGLENEEAAAPTTPTTTQPSDEGAALFASQGCGGCHVLAAAGSQGAVGPSLDETQLTEPEIAAVVANGRGAMPAFSGSLDQGEIDALAAYIARSASGSP